MKEVTVHQRSDGRWEARIAGRVEFVHWDELLVKRWARAKIGTGLMHPYLRDLMAGRALGYPLPRGPIIPPPEDD